MKSCAFQDAKGSSCTTAKKLVKPLTKLIEMLQWEGKTLSSNDGVIQHLISMASGINKHFSTFIMAYVMSIHEQEEFDVFFC